MEKKRSWPERRQRKPKKRWAVIRSNETSVLLFALRFAPTWVLRTRGTCGAGCGMYRAWHGFREIDRCELFLNICCGYRRFYLGMHLNQANLFLERNFKFIFVVKRVFATFWGPVGARCSKKNKKRKTMYKGTTGEWSEYTECPNENNITKNLTAEQ